MGSEGGGLIEAGIRQGALLDCTKLSRDVLSAVKDCRAIVAQRIKGVSQEQLLLVLSQDCDIANNSLQHIEVLAVKRRNKIRGGDLSYSRPRNYGKLFLPHEGKYLECKAEAISIIPKVLLTSQDLTLTECLDEKSRRILLDWRVGTYVREPFPHNFNEQFLGYLRGSEKGLGDFLEQQYQSILDLYIYVYPYNDEHAPSYDVSVTAILSEDCDNETSEHIRETLEGHWKSLHQESQVLNFGQLSNKWMHSQPDVFLDIVAKPEDITLADINQLKRFNTDFLCYPDDEDA